MKPTANRSESPHLNPLPQAREEANERSNFLIHAQIGLLKAIKDYDLKRIISFHSRVKRAEAFTTDMQNTMQWISDEHRPSGTLRTDFVSGNMSANKRKIKLDERNLRSASTTRLKWYVGLSPMRIVTATPIDKNRQGTGGSLCLSPHSQRKN